jgi:hypothetical protein
MYHTRTVTVCRVSAGFAHICKFRENRQRFGMIPLGKRQKICRFSENRVILLPFVSAISSRSAKKSLFGEKSGRFSASATRSGMPFFFLSCFKLFAVHGKQEMNIFKVNHVFGD